MALRIFTNLSSQFSQRHLELNRIRLGASINRMASGIRLTRSADDAAGSEVSQYLKSDIRTLKQGARNLNDGLAMIHTAEGALNEQASILIRLRELASQATTGTIGQSERQSLQLEFSVLRAEMDRISKSTEFNGKRLIDGSLAASSPSIVLQIGADSSEGNRINLNQDLNLTAVNSTALGLNDEVIVSINGALRTTDALDTAIIQLSKIRGRVGAAQNRLTLALDGLNDRIEGLHRAVSTIRDADIAEEVAILTRNQIAVQASAAMVGQSNLIPQSILPLL